MSEHPDATVQTFAAAVAGLPRQLYPTRDVPASDWYGLARPPAPPSE